MKRTYTGYRMSSQKSNDQYGQVQRRPFKKVRATATGLVPYGPSRMYPQRPIGARSVTKGVDVLSTDADVFTNMANSTHVYPLNLIQAGTGSWNRVGRVLTMRSIRIRHNIRYTLAATSANSLSRSFRYLIVYDKQPNGTLPVKTDIIQYKDQSGTETGNWNGFLSYDNMQRFTILKDDTINFDPKLRTFDNTGTPTQQIELEKNLECYIRMNHITNYKSENSPAQISDISTGALYLVWLTDNPGAVAGATMRVDALSRLRYTDQ